jgi:hypothetical protein
MSKDAPMNINVAHPDPMSPCAGVSRMQAKLHRWAAADLARRLDDLFNLVHDSMTLLLAFDRVRGRSDQGAAPDGALRTSAGRPTITVMSRVTRAAAAAMLAAVLFGSVSTAATADATPICAGALQITHLAFGSATVARGQSATAQLRARNCTAQTVTTTLVWSGRYLGSSIGAIPPGCPVIDPIAKQVTFAPYGQDTDNLSYLILPACTATALQTTTTFDGPNGTVLAQANAQVAITTP